MGVRPSSILTDNGASFRSNDFAKACGIPLDWREATRSIAQRLLEGNTLRRIDIGRMNDRYFANGAGGRLQEPAPPRRSHRSRRSAWPFGGRRWRW